jgi:hypothetical protein
MRADGMIMNAGSLTPALDRVITCESIIGIHHVCVRCARSPRSQSGDLPRIRQCPPKKEESRCV